MIERVGRFPKKKKKKKLDFGQKPNYISLIRYRTFPRFRDRFINLTFEF